MEESNRKLSTEQLMLMLGRKDIDMEILMYENSNLKKEIQRLEERVQELYDENVKLGGNISHDSSNI